MKGEARTQHNMISRERWQSTRKDASLAFGLGSPPNISRIWELWPGAVPQTITTARARAKQGCRLGVGEIGAEPLTRPSLVVCSSFLRSFHSALPP